MVSPVTVHYPLSDVSSKTMHEYRVTKYDPAFRPSTGGYSKNEWTRFADVGSSFDGVVLTKSEYERIEDAYVRSAIAFLGESGVTKLEVSGLENGQKRRLGFLEGTTLTLSSVGDVIRGLLREEFWCRLECDDGFVHTGWDFYMYIGVKHPCLSAQKLAGELGLFVEEFESPYKKEIEDTL